MSLRGRGFESHLAPHIARFQGLVSDRINLPREVHVPKRSIINHRWCLDVEVASEYIHLIGGIWKNLEFTCEEADLMPWPLYNKVASKGRSAQLQIGSNAASTLSFYSVQVIGYFIEIRYITICAITSAGSPKPPWMQKGAKERFTIRQDCIDVAPRRWRFYHIHFTAPPLEKEIANIDILVYFIQITFSMR